MRSALAAVALLFLAIAGAIVYGLTWGQFWAEGKIMLSIPWGIVTLIDIYNMFLLFLLWVVFREGFRWPLLIWVPGVLLGGSLTACLYVLLALLHAGGDWRLFWCGRRSLS